MKIRSPRQRRFLAARESEVEKSYAEHEEVKQEKPKTRPRLNIQRRRIRTKPKLY